MMVILGIEAVSVLGSCTVVPHQLVQVVVNEVEVVGALAYVVTAGWLTDKVNLVENVAFRTHPRVFYALRAVVEHFAVDRIVREVASIRWITLKR